MCGIVGYIGDSEALPILLSSLERLEYRGYDSAGVALIESGEIFVQKEVGKIRELVKSLWGKSSKARCGIGHTRWATHGIPSTENAHPHLDPGKSFAIVHNGIIENYKELKEDLINQGHIFTSQTDTEVIVHLIAKYYEGDLLEAVKKTIELLKGAFAFAVITKYEPDRIIGVKQGSPLVIGVGENENFLASDIPAILPYTKQIIVLDDKEIVDVTKTTISIYDFNGMIKTKHSMFVPWDIVSAEKSGYKHFMLKEIYEQPRVISDTVRGFLSEGISFPFDIKAINRVVMSACGSSYNASLIGKYLIERYAKIPVEVGYASEQRYEDIPIDENTLFIAISQSGETADTRFAAQYAKGNGAKLLSIVNVVGSSLDRESDYALYTHAGPEIGVAATKTFTAQIAVLYGLAAFMGYERGYMTYEEYSNKIDKLAHIPSKIEDVLQNADLNGEVYSELSNAKNAIYLGRGLSFPIALEGALKLKEISYIHAEGYAAGEMKHGPIALIDENMPVVFIAPKDKLYEKAISNIEEVLARKAKLIVIGSASDQHLRNISKHFIGIPDLDEEDLYPLISVLPLQLIAYEVASRLGLDVDQPRNLAKTVTVE
ncbi:glutamine--fructose-6-phosphate transaminase (isomerizing) [Hydrogenobaculum acidophilum]